MNDLNQEIAHINNSFPRFNFKNIANQEILNAELTRLERFNKFTPWITVILFLGTTLVGLSIVFDLGFVKLDKGMVMFFLISLLALYNIHRSSKIAILIRQKLLLLKLSGNDIDKL
jgi:hypothetical protein